MKKELEKKEGDKVPSKEEVFEKVKASSRRMLDNLLAARQVAPDDLPPEQRAELDHAIAKAERLAEEVEDAFREKDIKNSEQ